jgi:phosphate uptake regulator
MLKEILAAFSRKDVINEMSQRVGEMLEAGQWMFEQASEVIIRSKPWAQLADPLYNRDRTINRAEQEIRGTIVTHLSVGNTDDLAPCLMMMNVVKDAERIGDLCKNIFEVGKFYADPFEHEEFSRPLDEIRATVGEMFALTRKTFLEHTKGDAREVIQEGRDTGNKCDLLIQQLLRRHENIAPHEAVAYVLLARHYKRVAIHLSNIATSVVSPVPLLDFPGKADD